MSILQSSNDVDNASSTLDLHEYALALHALGFTVIPIHDHSKTAIIEWKKYQTQQQTVKEVTGFPWSQNIAALSGPNGFLNFDLDGCTNPDIPFKVQEELGLPYDYPWTIYSPGRGGGFHTWIRCLETLPFLESVTIGYPLIAETFEHVELRTHNCYTILPPSLHPDTHTPYTHAFADPSMIEKILFSHETPSIAVVPARLIKNAFHAIATCEKETQKDVTVIDMAANKKREDQIETKEKSASHKKSVRYDAWAQKALTQELERLQATLAGNRNNQLNKSAFSLGQIIGTGLLEQDMVEHELTRVAEFIGLPIAETQATITSGLTQGLKQPRMPKQVFEENEPPLKLLPLHNPHETAFDEKLVSFSADDLGNAEAVYYLFGKYITYNDAYGWMVWNGTNFIPSIHNINILISKTIRLRAKAAHHMECKDVAAVAKNMAGRVTACRSMLESLAHIDVELFDNEPDLINTKSGIVHLRTKKIIPHDPSYHFTWCASVGYDPNANMNPWLDFLSETVESLEMMGYLKKSLGYSITGHTSEENMFYVFGPPRSGKGTMCEIILSIFPRPISIEVDFNSFTAKRENDSQNFDLAPLKASRIVFASESNKYQSLNPAKIKQLTGGNLVHCAFKHRDFFAYRPQYVVWLSSNHEVNGDPDDDALWGRIKVIIFPHSKLGSEDKSLKYRMQSPEILAGVLCWLVEGASEWYQLEGKGLETPDAVKKLTQEQRDAQDSIGLWLEECCEIKEGEWTENTKVRISYENWCEANGYEPKKAKGLSQSLAAHGCDVRVQKRIISTSGMKDNRIRGIGNLRVF